MILAIKAYSFNLGPEKNIGIEKRVAHALINTKHESHVYCLQGVESSERHLLKTLKDKHFTVVHVEESDGDVFDTALALSTERFTEITNHSFKVSDSTTDVAVATATDLKTGERLAFVSADLPHTHFEEIMQKLSTLGSCAIQVIGADFQARPEDAPERFDAFSQRDFQLLRTNQFTERNFILTHTGAQEPSEESEGIYAYLAQLICSIWEAIKSLFCSKMGYASKVAYIPGWHINKDDTDQIPALAHLKYHLVKESKICQLWHTCFSCCPSNA